MQDTSIQIPVTKSHRESLVVTAFHLDIPLIEKLGVLLDTSTDILRHQFFSALHSLFLHRLCLFGALIDLVTIVLVIRASIAFGSGCSLLRAGGGYGSGGIIGGTSVRVNVVRLHETLITLRPVGLLHRSLVYFLLLFREMNTYAAPLVTIEHSLATLVKSIWLLSTWPAIKGQEYRAYFSMVRMANTTQQKLELLVGAGGHFASTLECRCG